jgi:hypothetical protein
MRPLSERIYIFVTRYRFVTNGKTSTTARSIPAHEEEVKDESQRTLLSCTENGVLDGEIRAANPTPNKTEKHLLIIEESRSS